MRSSRAAPRCAWLWTAALLLSALVLVVACGDDSSADIAAPQPSAESPPTESPAPEPSSAAAAESDEGSTPEARGGCVEWGTASLEPDLDPSDGTFAATVSNATGTGLTDLSVDFDIVQWLTGEPAVDAYVAANPDDPDATAGPPNDYFVLNEHEETSTAPVAPDADVWLVRLAETGTADIEPGTVDELPVYLATGSGSELYWLTFADGTIVGVCEQYVP